MQKFFCLICLFLLMFHLPEETDLKKYVLLSPIRQYTADVFSRSFMVLGLTLDFEFILYMIYKESLV